MSRRPDRPALVAGLVVLVLGVVLLLDRADVLELGFGVIPPAFLAAVGAILLANGLEERRATEPAGPGTLHEP